MCQGVQPSGCRRGHWVVDETCARRVLAVPESPLRSTLLSVSIQGSGVVSNRTHFTGQKVPLLVPGPGPESWTEFGSSGILRSGCPESPWRLEQNRFYSPERYRRPRPTSTLGRRPSHGRTTSQTSRGPCPPPSPPRRAGVVGAPGGCEGGKDRDFVTGLGTVPPFGQDTEGKGI